MPEARCACIDIGSNTTALLVADVEGGRLRQVAYERRFTMLASSVGPSGIDQEKIAEVAEAVAELLAVAESHGAGEIALIGTHVVREAHNGHQIEAAVAARTGHAVEVIDGHKEARYSFIGAVGGLSRVSGPTVVIDVGGGSTEVSWCRAGGEPTTASIAIGSASLRSGFLVTDPPRAEELAQARAHATAELSHLVLPPELGLALAVGGGASTARELTGGVLERDAIARVFTSIDGFTSAELAERFSLPIGRAQLLPAGLTILDAFASLIGRGLEVGIGGLREGFLIDRYGS